MNKSDADQYALLLIGAMVGAVLGLVFYVAGGALLETAVVPLLVAPGTPRLSYGQQWGLIMCPLAALFGGTIGMSLALCRVRNVLWGAGCLSVSILAIGGIVASMWQSQVAHYGRDVGSELVLYAPFLAASVVTVVVALICAVWPKMSRVTMWPLP